MYTALCEDPDCKNCRYTRRISEVHSEEVGLMAARKEETIPMGQSLEEENRSKILRTIEKSIKEILLESAEEKESYFKSVKKVKDEIHCRIGHLIEVLRQREQELCHQVDESWRNELEKINLQATFKSLDKSLPVENPYKLEFQCEFNSVSSTLKNFGQVSNELKKDTRAASLKQVQDVNQSILLLERSMASAPMPSKFEKWMKDVEDAYLTESLWPKTSGVGLKRLENLEILSDLQRCARRTENIKRESGLQRLENLEILNDLQKCARRTERLKMIAKAQFEASTQPFDKCLDSVESKEVEKDNSSVTIAKSRAVDDFSHANAFNDPKQRDLLKNLANLSPKERNDLCWKSLREIELACMKANNSALLMREKWDKAHNDFKRERQQSEEKHNSACGAEFGKYDASDEDDMEIISRSEAASIPSETPAMPPKNRFRFGRKRSWCPSLYAKKPVVRKNGDSASPGVISPAEVIRSFVANMPSTNEPINLAPFILPNPGSSNVNDYEGMIELPVTAIESDEIPSVNEPEISSSDKGQGHDPSGALRSSFRRYLEKNAEDDWLSSSEQSQAAGNGCVCNGDGSLLEENLDQWLPAKEKQNLVADWLYTPRI